MPYTLTITGNLGRDPELRYTPGNATPVCNVSVATNRQWTSEDGTVNKETTWFKLVFWGKKAETINQYFRKGMPIWVRGRLEVDDNGGPQVYDWEGKPRADFKVNVLEWSFVSGGNGGGESHSQPNMDEDDIPF